MKTLRIITLVLVTSLCFVLGGCKSINQRFFKDSATYANAKEQPMPKFPKGSLAPSKRYDIPTIANQNGEIIAEILPPDY